jgi:hypothetical protein
MQATASREQDIQGTQNAQLGRVVYKKYFDVLEAKKTGKYKGNTILGPRRHETTYKDFLNNETIEHLQRMWSSEIWLMPCFQLIT